MTSVRAIYLDENILFLTYGRHLDPQGALGATRPPANSATGFLWRLDAQRSRVRDYQSSV